MFFSVQFISTCYLSLILLFNSIASAPCHWLYVYGTAQVRLFVFCFWSINVHCVKNHLFLLVIGVVIFIWPEFGATAIFRCDVMRPRAANCFAFIVDAAIGTLLGLCCWICGCACCGWFVWVGAKFTLTLRNCCGFKFFTFDAATSWAANGEIH